MLKFIGREHYLISLSLGSSILITSWISVCQRSTLVQVDVLRTGSDSGRIRVDEGFDGRSISSDSQKISATFYYNFPIYCCTTVVIGKDATCTMTVG